MHHTSVIHGDGLSQVSRKSVPDSVPVVLNFEAALHVVAITMAVPDGQHVHADYV